MSVSGSVFDFVCLLMIIFLRSQMFQSTLPRRGATAYEYHHNDILTRTPCECQEKMRKTCEVNAGHNLKEIFSHEKLLKFKIKDRCAKHLKFIVKPSYHRLAANVKSTISGAEPSRRTPDSTSASRFFRASIMWRYTLWVISMDS